MKKLTQRQVTHFHSRVVDWFQLNGRKNLPWQQLATPYRVWISEVMLQQTQVETVIPYFNNFIQRFPSIKSLANADINEVLHLWSGLGYYARARNLHKTAEILQQHHNLKLPLSVEALQQLPGIGRSTAGAIQSLGHQNPAAILDGNVKRVLARHYKIEGWPGKSAVLNQLWEISELLTPDSNTADYNQAMMDLGSLVCRRSKPECNNCPIQTTCQAKKINQISLFPGKKPSKIKPTKQQNFYLITDKKGRLLLHQRPPIGIWGGLWCLPDKNELEDAGLKAINTKVVSEFTHQFSHFTLQAKVIMATTTLYNEIMDAPNWNWYDPNNPNRVGMPTPLIKVIQDFKES